VYYNSSVAFGVFGFAIGFCFKGRFLEPGLLSEFCCFEVYSLFLLCRVPYWLCRDYGTKVSFIIGGD